MELTRLKQLYISIKDNKYTYALFKFQKNDVIFDVLFDIGVIPFKLGFILKNGNFDLWINVTNEFSVNPIIENNKYKELVKLLGLRYDPNNIFSPYAFFQEFNSKIPKYFTKPDEHTIILISFYNYDIEENDKIYFKQFITWKTQFRTEKNTEKTRLLFPEIFDRIKDRKNISVCYTHIPNLIKDR